jgi:hypothetical protein
MVPIGYGKGKKLMKFCILIKLTNKFLVVDWWKVLSFD